jgi:hypothetical protein
VTFTEISSHLAFALLAFLPLPVRRLPVWARAAFLVGAALLSLVPYRGLSLATYLRSLTDDLAITTLMWLGWCALAKIRGIAPLPPRRHLQLALCFGLLALWLYPATLGLSIHDPYRLGYSPRLLLAAIFAISLLCWWGRHYFGTVLLAAATLSFVLELKPSNNYWDYLLDPLLGLYCVLAVLWHAGRRTRRKWQESRHCCQAVSSP